MFLMFLMLFAYKAQMLDWICYARFDLTRPYIHLALLKHHIHFLSVEAMQVITDRFQIHCRKTCDYKTSFPPKSLLRYLISYVRQVICKSKPFVSKHACLARPKVNTRRRYSQDFISLLSLAFTLSSTAFTFEIVPLITPSPHRCAFCPIVFDYTATLWLALPEKGCSSSVPAAIFRDVGFTPVSARIVHIHVIAHCFGPR
jgi:hypothetical protein